MTNHLRWASTLIRSLYANGVRHAVISPGSRSTPLTIALSLHPGIKKHVLLDERSAAFMALGIGKESGRPAVLVCTSGTAAANYYPAVIEAKESGVPMVILSADRPPNLRGIGSSQTIDQLKLYGDHAVFFHEVGETKSDETDLKRLTFAGEQAVADSIRIGGAAHLNMAFRKPLEPTSEQIDQEASENSKQLDEDSSFDPGHHQTVHLGEELSALINESKQPLLIAGPANHRHSLANHVQKMADRINAPVIAEPGSGVEGNILRYEQFLRDSSTRKELEPDLILRFGDQPFTKSMLTTLADWSSVDTIHFSARYAWQDSEMSRSYFIPLQQNDKLDLTSINPKTDENWQNAWQKLERSSQETLTRSLDGTKPLTDGHLFSHISQQFSDSWRVMISNSLPPRDMALFGQFSTHQFVNRGTAGIDGILSTAIGISSSSGAPTCCIMGDLAFLHDSNALLALQNIEQPFVVVVINNGGGNIFRMLPIYQQDKEMYSRYFETPQSVQIQKLTEAHGIHYRRIETRDDLEQFYLSNLGKTPQVIECVTDSKESMKLRNKLWGNS